MTLRKIERGQFCLCLERLRANFCAQDVNKCQEFEALPGLQAQQVHFINQSLKRKTVIITMKDPFRQ